MPISGITDRKLKLYVSPRSLKDLVDRLRVGETLKARVLEVFENNRYSIRIKGFNVVAESFSTLTKGGWIPLQVRELGDKIIMQLMSADERKAIGKGEIKTARIGIFYKGTGRKRKIDVRNTRIVFLLDTRGLGQLKIKVDVVEERISCHIGVETGVARAIIEENIEELKASLEGLNYLVPRIGCSLSEKDVEENRPVKDYLSLFILDRMDVIV